MLASVQAQLKAMGPELERLRRLVREPRSRTGENELPQSELWPRLKRVCVISLAVANLSTLPAFVSWHQHRWVPAAWCLVFTLNLVWALWEVS